MMGDKAMEKIIRKVTNQSSERGEKCHKENVLKEKSHKSILQLCMLDR
jgi:hypothetical protein